LTPLLKGDKTVGDTKLIHTTAAQAHKAHAKAQPVRYAVYTATCPGAKS